MLVKARRMSEQETMCEANKSSASHLETTLKLKRIINELLGSKQSETNEEVDSLTTHESRQSSQVDSSSRSNN